MLKDAGFDEALAASAPYVVQHAEESGLSLQDAAEDILFQAQLFHEHLEKTERVRLALFRKIKRARTPWDLDQIIEKFQRDGVA
jgi:aspartyl/asparaginyl beta-hydroxylase (cupin superfamily)